MAVGAIAGGSIIGGLIAGEGQQSAASTQANAANQATQLQYKMYQQQRADLAPWRQAGVGALNALWGTPGTPEQTIQGAPIYGNALSGGNVPMDASGNPIPQYITYIGGEAGPQTVLNPAYVAAAGNISSQPQITGYKPSTTIPATTGTQGLIQKGPGEFTESPSYQFALSEGLKAQQRAASATGRLGSGAYLKDATQYAKNLASEEYQNFLNRYYQSLNPYFSMAGLGQIGTTQSANAAGQYGQQAGQNALYAGNATAAGQLGQANTLANMFNWGGQQAGNYLYQQQLANQQFFPAYGGVNSPTYGYMTPSQMNSMTWL